MKYTIPKLTRRFIAIRVTDTGQCYYLSPAGGQTSLAEYAEVFGDWRAAWESIPERHKVPGEPWHVEQLPYGKKENAIRRGVEICWHCGELGYRSPQECNYCDSVATELRREYFNKGN